MLPGKQVLFFLIEIENHSCSECKRKQILYSICVCYTHTQLHNQVHKLFHQIVIHNLGFSSSTLLRSFSSCYSESKTKVFFCCFVLFVCFFSCLIWLWCFLFFFFALSTYRVTVFHFYHLSKVFDDFINGPILLIMSLSFIIFFHVRRHKPSFVLIIFPEPRGDLDM